MVDLRLKTLLLLFVVGLANLQEVYSQEPTPPVYRLPSTVTPSLYMLRLEPDLDTGVVKGAVKIEINTTSDKTQILNAITLHLGTGVTVDETTGVIVDLDGAEQNIGAFVYDDENTLLTLELPEGQTLSYNHMYVISLNFQTTLNTEPKGLFWGYFDSASKYVAINLRPTHAREVFPCFDEPHFKVPISLQVVKPISYYAISTAPLASSLNITADQALDTFLNTGPISIHSLGLFISNQTSVGSMGVNLIVPVSLPKSVPFLESTISSIRSQFGTFPINPLNLIVLPDITHTSFSAYGFVFTSPEVYLGQVGSPLQWTSLQLELTEELVRQYLEYSKTPQWWSDLWLSESIGAYLALGFQQDEPWLSDWMNIVIRSEALGDYTSVTSPVIPGEDLSKWDIENIITSQAIKFKGLSTLIMWDKTMPEGLVIKTVLDFLKLPQSVVSTNDLLTIMVSNIEANKTYDVTPAVPLLPNWLTQPGSPLVWFTVDSTNTTFTLDQGTPCPAGGSVPALRSVSVALAEGPSPDWNNIRQGNWLLNASTQWPFSDPSQALIGSIINIETAPFRVNYQDPHWNTLIQDLAANWTPVAVARAIQDDAVALSLLGCLDFSTALSALSSIQHSGLDWWPVVKATDAIIAEIGSDWYGFTAFGSYFANLFTPDLLNKLDVRKSTSYPELSVARELVTPWLCRFNIGSCREAVVELGGPLWQGNTSGIAGSDLENVACYGARYTTGALGPLLDAYQSAESAWLRRYYTIALSCLTDPSSVNELLDTIIDSTSNSSQKMLRSSDPQVTLTQSDARQILLGLASSLENSQALINTILSQPKEIQTRFGVNTLSLVIKNLGKNRVDLSQLSSLHDDTLDLDPYVVQSVDQAIVTTNLSQTWYNDYSSQLYVVLPQGQSTTTVITTSAGTSTIAPGTSPTTTPATSTAVPTTPPTAAPSPTPAPGGASALYDFRVFTLVLSVLLITLDVTLR